MRHSRPVPQAPQAGDVPPAGRDGDCPESIRFEWLGWDSRSLRWRVSCVAATTIELHLDDVVFQRYPCAPGDAEFDCTFDYSPTGNAELAFTLSGADGATASAAWRVLLGMSAQGGADQWTRQQPHLSALAGTPRLPRRALAELPAVAVVVPIYNAADSVRRCLAALERWTPASARWILVDDASSDAAIAPLLAHHAQRAGVQVLRHDVNRGYTRGINTGIAAAGDADVVLLNSDTEVGPRWLESLRLAAYGDDTIGTVTAVSDNAGAFSVPELEQYCPTPSRWNLVEAQRAVLQQAGLRFPELPTGNGFCLFIKRAVIARIGIMDADAFPAGYGEENDFCQRAIDAGYRNVIAGSVLVRHERSASFGDARRATLGAQGMAVLRRRYPRYEADVGATLYSFERRALDYRVRRTWAGSDAYYARQAPRPRLLIAGPEPGSGAAPLMRSCEIFVLQQHPSLRLHRLAADGVAFDIAAAGTAACATPAGRIRAWLIACAIEQVLITASDPFGVLVGSLAGELGIPLAGEATRLASAV
ncbi:MAG TPA: glycosyltransferase family 2 protein [Rudaea sp.]|jgi:GT2 family glycosyltransferase